MPPRIWFASCIGVDFATELIPHFLRHYRDLGIPPERFLLVLNTKRRFGQALRRAKEVCAELRVRPGAVWVGQYTSEKKQARVRKLLDRNVRPDDWVVHADADELQEYPKPLPEVIADLEAEGVNALKGVLTDRIAEDGSLREVLPDVSVWDQFPVECGVGVQILELDATGTKHKMMMYRGDLRPNRGSGKIDDAYEHLATYSISDLKIHHFKWTADVRERLEDRIRHYKKKGMHWWKQSQRFLDYYEEHGRIRPEDVE